MGKENREKNLSFFGFFYKYIDEEKMVAKYPREKLGAICHP